MREQIRRLAKGTLVYGIGEVLNRLISFLLLPLFTSCLTPHDYGVLSILALLGFVITPVFSLGFGSAIGLCYFDGNSEERKRATIWTAFTILIASSLLLLSVGIPFSSAISEIAFQKSIYQRLVALTLLNTCLTILTIPFRLYLQLEEMAYTYVMFTLISTTASVIFNVFMVIVLRRGVEGFVEAGLWAQMITFLLFLFASVSQIKYRFNWRLTIELIRLGIPLIPSFAFVFILLQANRYILQWLCGLDVVGIYTIGFNLGLAIGLVTSGFQNAWLPYFMSYVDCRSEASYLFGRILTYYVLIFGGLSLLFYIFAKPVISIMTQPAFHDAYKVVGLTSTAQVLLGVFSILLPGMYFAKEVRYLCIIQALAAAIAIVANFLLIPSIGLLGAGIALVLGVLALAVIQHIWNLSKRETYLSVSYEWTRIGNFTLIYLIYVVVLLWERNLTMWAELTLSIVSAALIPVVIFMQLNNSERNILFELVKQGIPLLVNRLKL